MKRIVKAIATGQKGFTLLELLVVLAILTAVTGAISVAIISIGKLSPHGSDWAVALEQAQNAGYWISRDIQMSRSINIAPANPQFLILTVPEWDYGNNVKVDSTITYELDGSGTLKSLTRSKNNGPQIVISDYIYYNPDSDPDNSTRVISYVPGDTDPERVLRVRIAAAVNNVTVAKEYQAKPTVPNWGP